MNNSDRHQQVSVAEQQQLMATARRRLSMDQKAATVEIDNGVRMAQALRQNGLYGQAIEVLERALRVAAANYPSKYHPSVVQILWQIGRTHHVVGNLREAIITFEEVLDLSRRLMQHEIVADVLFRLGHIKQYMGDFAAAEAYYGDALHVAIIIHGTRFHMDIATILFNMGMLARGQGVLERAQALYEEAVRIALAISGPHFNDFIRDGLELIAEAVLARGVESHSNDGDQQHLMAIAQRTLNYPYLESIADALLVATCETDVQIDHKSCAPAA